MFGLFYITRKDWKTEHDIQLAWAQECWKRFQDKGEDLRDMRDSRERMLDRVIDLEKRLDAIAAQETPSANATVKRMAAIARGERTS